MDRWRTKPVIPKLLLKRIDHWAIDTDDTRQNVMEQALARGLDELARDARLAVRDGR